MDTQLAMAENERSNYYADYATRARSAVELGFRQRSPSREDRLA